MKLWQREGGGRADGVPRLVLVHGLGANADVWGPMTPHIGRRWIAPDLRGHGRSPHGGLYSYAGHAADVADVLEQHEEVDIVGHSMGGVVAMALATGWFGLRVRKVIAFGVKIRWTPEEVAKLHALAQTPARQFATEAEARERYLKVSGLAGLVDPADPMAASGVRAEADGFRVATDQRAYAAAGPDVAAFVKAMRCPLRLAAGRNDPMCALEDMTAFDPRAHLIDAAGHNAQVERPAELWQFIEGELAREH